MEINNSTIDALLYGEESVDLDFKRDQYKFIGATDDEKSELLKDIIAFTNCWRRSDAIILIGVEEVKGGRSKVCGIIDKLDDAQIQQFVNSKTNCPITFSYRNMEFEGETIGVLHIPIQYRPVYLKKDYGKLKRETVYIRRGSSTDIAKLDEISKMGNSLYQKEQGGAVLEIFFADLKERRLVSDICYISSTILKIPNKKNIPDYEFLKSNRTGFMHIEIERANYSYYRELSVFIKQFCLYKPIYFAIKNTGSKVARDVRIEIKIKDENNLIKAIDRSDILSVPKASYSIINPPIFYPNVSINNAQYLNVERISDYWLVEAGLDKVQPKSTAWLEKALYLGAIKPLEFWLETEIYSDDLSEPSIKKLIVNSGSEEKEANLENILGIESERYSNTNEY